MWSYELMGKKCRAVMSDMQETETPNVAVSNIGLER